MERNKELKELATKDNKGSKRREQWSRQRENKRKGRREKEKNKNLMVEKEKKRNTRKESR